MTPPLVLAWSCAFIGLLLIFGVEQLVRPKLTLPWRRPWSSFLLTSGVWLVLFALFAWGLGRPIFSTLILLALWLLLVFANNAKFEALKEPFLFQDYDYIVDLFKHPRLFLPFLGIGRAFLVVVGVAVAIGLGFGLEPSVTPSSHGLFNLGVMGMFGVFLLVAGHLMRPVISVEPQVDVYNLGLVAFYWAYAIAQFSQKPPLLSPFAHSALSGTPEPRPHVIAVQSESFFDPRLICPSIAKQLGSDFDEVLQQAFVFGEVEVPAWGANTVRSEFAFLTGVLPKSLGVHGFNPYRLISRRPEASLVRRFKEQGYRTVAIHPYPASFYARDRVYPLLGFDEFYDISAFDQATRFGPYVADHALFQFVEQLIQESPQPVFVFVVTMENHGPLHLEPMSSHEMQALFTEPQPEQCRDLAIYLRHWRNAGAMAKNLMHLLTENAQRPGKLLWYGDHVPIMDTVYQHYGMPSGHTPFFVFDTKKLDQSFRVDSKQKIFSVQELGHFLL